MKLAASLTLLLATATAQQWQLITHVVDGVHQPHPQHGRVLDAAHARQLADEETLQPLSTYALLSLDEESVADALNPANNRGQLSVSLPARLDGKEVAFDVDVNGIMPQTLQDKFPQIRAYSGRAVNDPSVAVNMDFSSFNGLHAQIFVHDGGEWYLEPASSTDRSVYRLYDVHRQPDANLADGFTCGMNEEPAHERISEFVSDGNNQTQCIANWVGDMYCDDRNNNAECGWDGGDCCKNDADYSYCIKNPELCRCLDPEFKTEDANGCVAAWNGNEYCELENNREECKWDGGDCCDPDKVEKSGSLCEDPLQCRCLGQSPDENECVAAMFNDGVCDPGNNKAECNYDNGDCCKSELCADESGTDCGCKDPRKDNCQVTLLRDGICNLENNSEECGYDDGDCCLHKSLIDYNYREMLLNRTDCELAAADPADCACKGQETENGCIEKYIGDFFCDPVNNNEKCGFDGGDCCGVFADYQYCDDENDENCACKNGADDRIPEVTPRTYRLAVSTTASFTALFSKKANLTQVEAGPAVAEVVTVFNRAAGVFRRTLAVDFELVESLESLIQLPNVNYSISLPNSASALMYDTNRTHHDWLVNEIGQDSFDIGHVLTTDGTGIGAGKACTDVKGLGTTGYSRKPDGFYNYILAHEIGHQFSANHTWSGCGDSEYRTLGTIGYQYEAFSGVTIMSYATSCSQGLNVDVDDPMPRHHYFHIRSLQEINHYVNNQEGNRCGTVQSTKPAPPLLPVDGMRCTIPVSTPFVLSGKGAHEQPEISGDYRFNWEQIDREGTVAVGMPLTFGPLFVSVIPTSSSVRTFPAFGRVLENTAAEEYSMQEVLPPVKRKMRFALTVRDFYNQKLKDTTGDFGTYSTNVASVNVASVGPLEFASGNKVEQVAGGINVNLKWNVKGTDTLAEKLNVYVAAPVSGFEAVYGREYGYEDAIRVATGVSNSGVFNATIPMEDLVLSPTFADQCDNPEEDTVSFDVDRLYVILEAEQAAGCAFFALTEVDVAVDMSLEVPCETMATEAPTQSNGETTETPTTATEAPTKATDASEETDMKLTIVIGSIAGSAALVLFGVCLVICKQRSSKSVDMHTELGVPQTEYYSKNPKLSDV